MDIHQCLVRRPSSRRRRRHRRRGDEGQTRHRHRIGRDTRQRDSPETSKWMVQNLMLMKTTGSRRCQGRAGAKRRLDVFEAASMNRLSGSPCGRWQRSRLAHMIQVTFKWHICLVRTGENADWKSTESSLQRLWGGHAPFPTNTLSVLGH